MQGSGNVKFAKKSGLYFTKFPMTKKPEMQGLQLGSRVILYSIIKDNFMLR